MSAPSKIGVEGKDSKGKSPLFSLGLENTFSWPCSHPGGVQSYPAPLWKVTKAGTVNFLVIFVAAKLLVCKFPPGLLNQYPGE